MKTVTRRVLLTSVMFLACATPAMAQPSKPITLLVPFAAGGATDQLARVVAQRLTERNGLTVVVENRPGGGSQIAINALKQAPADGATLFMGDIGAFALNQFMYKKLSYDVSKDLQPVSMVGKAPLFLMVPAASPYNTVQDLVAAAKTTDLSYGSPGIGTGAHVAAELLRARAGVRLTHIPYRGAAPALVDLTAGHVSLLFDPMASSGPFVRDGKLRALSVADTRRSPQLPDVPTLEETGVKGVTFVAWFGIAAKAGTPDDVVQKLSKQIREAIASPEVMSRFSAIGIDASPSTPAEFAQAIRADASRYGPLIKSLDINLD